MEVKVKKITDEELMVDACEATHRGSSQSMNLEKIYKCKHSPIRTQLFWVQMNNIPTFVSTHFVRHKIGVEHFVLSNRSDRGGAGNDVVTRKTPVNHCMFINAEALITMSRKRLCKGASIETQQVMKMIVKGLEKVDPELTKHMMPQCEYIGRCEELKGCGLYPNS